MSTHNEGASSAVQQIRGWLARLEGERKKGSPLGEPCYRDAVVGDGCYGLTRGPRCLVDQLDHNWDFLAMTFSVRYAAQAQHLAHINTIPHSPTNQQMCSILDTKTASQYT